MFRFRRQVRHWSAGVLLLWLFGIGSALANACLSGHAAGLGAQLAQIDAHHSVTSAQDPVGSGDAPAPSKTNCQDFCDKSTISMPPLKAALDHAGAEAAHPPPLEMLCVVAASDPVQRWVPCREAGIARPITIALLRLAL